MIEELNGYFTSVFTLENTSSIPENREAEESAVVITKKKVLGKLKGLKVDKSPRTDGLHPRALKDLAEEIIENEIAEYLEVHGKVGLSQHNFIAGRPCLIILLESLEGVTSKLDKGEPMDMIYLDFQKAFDKVPQRRLLNKIRAHGIRGEGTGNVEEAERLRKDLDRLGEWLKKWQMEDNVGKCEFMHF
eukprot:g42831.t1